jgi:hypothetical protein
MVVNKIIVFFIFISFNSYPVKGNNCCFLGWKIELKEYPLVKKYIGNLRNDFQTNKEEIGKFQKEMLNSEFISLCNEIDYYRIKYRMTDFVFVELIKNIANQYSHGTKAKKLLVWQILKHFDYESFIQFSEKQLIIFSLYNTNFDNVAYIERGENEFFCDVFYDTSAFPEPMLKFSDDKVGGKKILIDTTCIGNISEANIESKKLKVIFNNKDYTIKYNINMDLVDFLNTLPKFKLGNIYTSNFGVSNILRNSLLKEIHKYVQNKDTIEGLNFILNFCQQIKYTDDIVLWKKERYFFPEQSLNTLNIDCDDKSILFSYLIRQIYNLSSVGILYDDKNHINVGVLYKKSNNNEFVTFENKNYIVCEPTGNDFQVGQQNKDLKNSPYRIIVW